MTYFTFNNTVVKPNMSVATDNTIVMYCGDTEMLKISDAGFWVRGVLVEQESQEAQQVYNAFKQWLSWTALNTG